MVLLLGLLALPKETLASAKSVCENGFTQSTTQSTTASSGSPFLLHTPNFRTSVPGAEATTESSTAKRVVQSKFSRIPTHYFTLRGLYDLSPDLKSVLVSPDGIRVQLREANSGELLKELTQIWGLFDADDHAPMLELRFSSDGQRIVVTGRKGQVFVFSLSGKLLHSFQPRLDPADRRLLPISVNALQDRVVLTFADGVTQMWTITDEGSAALQPSTEPHHQAQGAARKTLLSPSQDQILALFDKHLVTWRVDKQDSRRSDIFPHWISSVNFRHDGKQIVVTTYGNQVVILDAETLTTLHPLPQTGDVQTAQFSPDGKWILTVAEDGDARIIDIATGKTVISYFLPDPIISASFNKEGNQVLALNQKGELALWTTTDPSLRLHLKLAAPINYARFTDQGRILTIDETGMVQILKLQP